MTSEGAPSRRLHSTAGGAAFEYLSPSSRSIVGRREVFVALRGKASRVVVKVASCG
jgi:hypothetical protein